MKPIQSNFGLIDDKKVDLYTLKNANGMVVKITNYGATITSIQIPNKKGDLVEIACGFDTLDGYFSDDYKENAPYFGSTVGRYCSQIKDANFTLNGKQYQLEKNCGPNNLHGGTVGFDKRLWSLDSTNENLVKLTLISKDLEEGFPGNVTVSVTFSLTENNELTINYNAITDADTPLSLTNHTYFNLSGFNTSIENHTAQVFTNKRLKLDNTGAATGEIVDVSNAVDDLRNPKKIADAHNAMNDGFEHFYVFDNTGETVTKVATVANENEQLSLDVFTTEPCMLLYTGKYTANNLKRENGLKYGKYRGFCCETHRYPNGPNIKNSPKSITKAGENFKSTTVFKFSF
ncbi:MULTISPECIES: aldose epimerase family protein [unclassified Cellulophaga]|uniref:aldose epimerase family protein n=1 Tax=unclassified Cellulophaga TaxID=2634405 RepID=UPI0026E2D3FA|nr:MULTISPECIES: aldose epimerase family protein [unclassified Cellulophaga]MDO6492722.1 aldose epimerase family protein [Cellulophaga sp. 2_MG-2023]MDO6495979.1 aldose epimerase family protein [Cellulophaga sp. 3_MG-2023]